MGCVMFHAVRLGLDEKIIAQMFENQIQRRPFEIRSDISSPLSCAYSQRLVSGSGTPSGEEEGQVPSWNFET